MKLRLGVPSVDATSIGGRSRSLMGRLLSTDDSGSGGKPLPSVPTSSHSSSLRSSTIVPSFTMYNSLTQTSGEDLLEAAGTIASRRRTAADPVSQSHHNKENKWLGLACYTCGPTTYAPAHLGHARTYVWLDIFRRALEHHHHCSNGGGQEDPRPGPLFVLNVTDVDDKILKAAAEEEESGPHRDPLLLARHYESAFWDDWDALHCLRPHIVTRVSDYVESHIVPYIQRLVDNGLAYTSDDGNDGDVGGDSSTSIYFDVRAYEDRLNGITRYGKLAPPAASRNMFSSPPSLGDRDADHDDDDQQQSVKRDPRDFCLWKQRKVGEALAWESPWGKGRPGWHIECSAMIEAVQDRFRDTHVFTVHCGGVDLKFPHHTNEIAQAEAYYLGSSNQLPTSSTPTPPHEQFRHGHSEWIPHWIHTGHLYIDGLKMSKSLKNFVTIAEMLCDKTNSNNNDDDDPATQSAMWSPADDFRLWCLGLSGSYRDVATYSPDCLQQARQLRHRMVRFLWDAHEFVHRTRNSGSANWSSQQPDLPQRLSERDAAFFASVQAVSLACHAALRSDLDGATYVREMRTLADSGRSYLAWTGNDSSDAPPPPLVSLVCHAAETLRGLLSLVGFSPVTCQAGAATLSAPDLAGRSLSSLPTAVGGERAVLDELVRFRAAVRNHAVAGLRARGTTETSSGGGSTDDNDNVALRHILAVCDDVRDRSLPTLGVELLDARSSDLAAVGESDAHSSAGAAVSSQWRYCLPRLASDATTKPRPSPLSKTSSSSDDLAVPPEDYYRTGSRGDSYSAWDDSGIPSHHADGTPVSNRLQQKLRKKLDAYVRRRRGAALDSPPTTPNSLVS